MSRHRISPQAGWVHNPSKLPKGPNGRALCRECSAEVPKGRRTFCGDACVDRWKLKTDPGHVRKALAKRDHGVCRRCGLNTIEIMNALWVIDGFNCGAHWDRVAPFGKPGAGRPYFGQELGALRRAIGIPHGRQNLWDADHILEVHQGGGECGLENYQTLCLWCHRAKTAEQRHLKAEESKKSIEQMEQLSNKMQGTLDEIQRVVEQAPG